MKHLAASASPASRRALRRSRLVVALLASVTGLPTLACATAHPARTPHAATAATPPHADLAIERATTTLAARGLVIRLRPTITWHADAASFAAATGQRDPSLRAWSTYATVDFMPVAVWAARDAHAVEQRITHELCHVALYQRFGSEAAARHARLPRFFEEGLCSVVAGQERLDVATLVALSPPMPLTADAFRADPELAYAAAHATIAHLDATQPRTWLAAVLDAAVADGEPGCVERALRAVVGLTPEELWRAVVDGSEASA